MAKFKLQPVLKVRQHAEDARKRDLAAAVSAENERKENALRLARLRQDETRVLRSAARQGSLDLSGLIEQRRWIGLLDREIQLRLGEVAQAERKTAVARQAMVEAMRDRKAVEILRERFVAEEKRKEDRVESAALDEAAAGVFSRTVGRSE